MSHSAAALSIAARGRAPGPCPPRGSWGAGRRFSRCQRYKVERLFGELKTRINLRRLRLRRLRNASEQFLMAATAQNLKRLVKHLDRLEVEPA